MVYKVCYVVGGGDGALLKTGTDRLIEAYSEGRCPFWLFSCSKSVLTLNWEKVSASVLVLQIL